MRIEPGDPLSFAPDHSGWTARFRDNTANTGWHEDVIGFAVVVHWAGWHEEFHPTDADQDLVNTKIVPVVLDQNHPITVTQYVENRSPGAVTFEGLERR